MIFSTRLVTSISAAPGPDMKSVGTRATASRSLSCAMSTRMSSCSAPGSACVTVVRTLNERPRFKLRPLPACLRWLFSDAATTRDPPEEQSASTILQVLGGDIGVPIDVEGLSREDLIPEEDLDDGIVTYAGRAFLLLLVLQGNAGDARIFE